MQAGTRVITDRFGPGTVIRATRTGVLVALSDRPGLKVEVALDQILPLEADVEPSAPLAASPAPALPVEHVGHRPELSPARRAVEALRFGLTPLHRLPELTLGYDRFREWALAYLPHTRLDQPVACEVVGPFGTGKSHAMATVRQICAAEGYLTARVEVDGQKLSLSSPDFFLHTLLATLAGPGVSGVTPVTNLHEAALGTGQCPAVLHPRTRDRTGENLWVVDRLRQDGILGDWREQVESVLTGNPDSSRLNSQLRATYGRGRYLFSAQLARAASERLLGVIEVLASTAMLARVAGFRGLVVTVDELEVERNATARSLQTIAAFFETLAQYLVGETLLSTAPLAFFFATVGQEGHRGDQLVDALIDRTAGGFYSLTAWGEADRRDLAVRIHDLYQEAYGTSSPFDPRLVDRVEAGLAQTSAADSGLIRAFMKQYLAALDAAYGPSAAVGGA